MTPKPLDKIIEELAPKIVERFVDEVRAHDLPPRPISREQVIDHLLAYLVDLVGALRGSGDAIARSVGIAAEHGQQRWYVGYDLRTIVLEYGVLRDSILTEVETAGVKLTARDFEAVVAYLTVGIASAVSEFAKRTTQELELALAAARQATEAREDVLSIVSHDLRSPLQVILGSADLIAEDAVEDRVANVGRSVGRIKRACSKMESLIGSLLELAKLKAGEVALAPGARPAESLVAEAVEHALPIAEGKGLRLTAGEVDAGTVRCDPERLLQVLANLLSNAIKFTKTGGVVTVGAKLQPGVWVFSVKDVGQGIAPTKVGHIFDRFWHGSDKASGTGLGERVAAGPHWTLWDTALHSARPLAVMVLPPATVERRGGLFPEAKQLTGHECHSLTQSWLAMAQARVQSCGYRMV